MPLHAKKDTEMTGLQNMFYTSALLLMSDVCSGICRFPFFRKRLFLTCEGENVMNIAKDLEYFVSPPDIHAS